MIDYNPENKTLAAMWTGKTVMLLQIGGLVQGESPLISAPAISRQLRARRVTARAGCRQG